MMSDSREAFEKYTLIPANAEFCDKHQMYKHKQYKGVIVHPINELWESFCEGVEWQSTKPEFTALCHSKARRIGTPVGLLVKSEAGSLAAVHNLGRVTWLDDCVAGPVEREASAQDGGEVVAWMHNNPERCDVIHTKVKDFITKASPLNHRPMSPAEHYTIPLYTNPPSAVVPEDEVSLQDAANKVCQHLPKNMVLSLCMENGAAWVELGVDRIGSVELPDSADKTLINQINDALCFAIGWNGDLVKQEQES
ncbi:hypothetical protein MIH18_23525 (plasmid) [Marinobacter sp. M3C]|uniref:hypothetical protein n=1 Tax=Marinobacter sp. M3C TaxID=2917715 RepID=UPI00200EEA52|nr:hypothetical protein [Marinobacter sp. M3C]MCL1485172.1 hypothetical protein [Marinobacter sp.]UQG62803.1 hypothetical protein MIH18_23525 [Marinobacter sp. M3C]